MKKSLIGMAITILIFLGGCATLQNLIEEPTLEFQKLTMKDTSLFQSTLVFVYAVTNPNPIDLSLDQLQYQVKIGDKNLAKGNLKKAINILARERQTSRSRLKCAIWIFSTPLRNYSKKMK